MDGCLPSTHLWISTACPSPVTLGDPAPHHTPSSSSGFSAPDDAHSSFCAALTAGTPSLLHFLVPTWPAQWAPVLLRGLDPAALLIWYHHCSRYSLWSPFMLAPMPWNSFPFWVCIFCIKNLLNVSNVSRLCYRSPFSGLTKLPR